MPAPSMLKGLPKPVLFGLYGAVGGLLGAIVLGEPLWHLLKPPPAPAAAKPDPVVTVSASAAVQLYPETTNAFVVQIARAEFDGPVTVKFPALPAGVTVKDVTIPAGKESGTVTVAASDKAALGTAKVTGVVEGSGGKPTATFALDVVVAATPPRLAVAVPAAMAVFRKSVCKFSVKIDRKGFDGDVTVSFPSPPEGLSLPPVVVKAGEKEAPVVATAADTAVLATDAKLSVVATAAGGVSAKAETRVNVLETPKTPVDIMFVLDCSGSMEPFIEGVRDGIRDFATELGSKQLDIRLGLLAFRDRPFGQENELLTFKDDNPFTTDTKLFAREVGKLKCIGNDTIPESALDGLAEAAELKEWRQQGTARVLLLITDAPPLAPDKRIKTVNEGAGILKDRRMDQLHLVLRKEDQKAYQGLSSVVPGKFFDLERVTKGGEKFASILPELSKAIAETVAERPSEAKVEATPPPSAGDAAKPTAAAAPAPPPAPTVASLQSSEKFAAGSETKLIVRSGAWAGAIAGLVCLALLAGQHHYLRGSLPAAGSAGVGFAGGLVAGLVGGVAGQGLYQMAPDSAAVGLAFRVLGWALLGGLAGIGLSLFIPNLKWVHGLAGGAAGGVAGAVGFLAVSSVTGDLVGRLVGGLVVGFCIGLMVALAEAAFRRHWLEVRYGARETVTVNLGPEPVKIGGDSKACTVWARGAAPLALRFFVRDGQVICDDAVMRRESTVAEGYSKEVGNVTVTVRTGSSAAPAAPAAPRPSAPARAAAPPQPQPAPMSLDDDDGDLLPMTAVSPPPAPASPPSAPSASVGVGSVGESWPTLDKFEPVPAPSPRPAAPGASKPALPAVPPRPPAPAGSKPALPSVGSKPTLPTVPPASPKPPPPPAGPKHPDACPSCGRVNAGPKGTRYCMVCDRTY